jgi:antitoxin component YwqK of YwqJK toxin-antitoxin module
MNWSKASIVAMCLIASLITKGQNGIARDTLNQLDSAGNKQGWWIEEFAQPVLDSDTVETRISEGRYIHGSRDGDWVTRYKGNGGVAITATYMDGRSIHCRAYDVRGRLSWSDSTDIVTGTLVSYTFYEDGQIMGLLLKSPMKHSGTTYWENGNVMSHWKHSAERRSDETYVFLDYWEDGTLRQRQEFIGEGVEHGTATRYYRNGQLEYECQYVFGKLNGEYKEYDEEGNLTDVMMWANGVRLW